MRWHTTAMALILLAFGGIALAQQADTDIAKDIKRIRKELMQVQDERARVKEEKQKDVDDFRGYRKRTQERLRSVRVETDSLRELIGATKNQNDSLNALIQGEKDRKRQYELLQRGFSDNISANCEQATQEASLLPPIITGKHLSALKLLQSELVNNSIDNVEGVARLTQILRDMTDLAGTIQIVQGSSPIPEIRGTAYRLRMGGFFEAVVNAKGTQAALWTGYDENGGAQWEQIEDPVVVGAILQAVNVREGKSLPELVELPLGHVPLKEGE